MSLPPVINPKRARRIPPSLVLIGKIGLVVLILGSMSLYVVSLSVHGQIEVVTETERRLLYNTDHARLASACEKLWRQREEVRKLVKPSNSTTAPIDVSSTHPSVPPEIQLLRVTGFSVEICPDYLRLELGGGFCHYGFFWRG